MEQQTPKSAVEIARERHILEVDKQIMKVYDEYAKTIKDPKMLAVMVARTYANAMLLSYKEYLDSTDMRVVRSDTKQNKHD